MGLMVTAKADPAWFYEKIWAKLIPKNVSVAVDGVIGLKQALDEAEKDRSVIPNGE